MGVFAREVFHGNNIAPCARAGILAANFEIGG